MVYAETSYQYNSEDVEFDNTKTELTLNGNSVDNVQDAIDALNIKADSVPQPDCASGYTKGGNALVGYSCDILLIRYIL